MDFSDVVTAIKVLQLRLAEINANWNGQGPDLMTPTEAAAFQASLNDLQKEVGTLFLKSGAFLGGTNIAVSAG